jgi:hypothetical protein
MRQLFSSGAFWMKFWLVILLVNLAWTVVSVIWFLDSTRNLTLLSLEALLVACGAGFQATLGMRMADSRDPLGEDDPAPEDG